MIRCPLCLTSPGHGSNPMPTFLYYCRCGRLTHSPMAKNRVFSAELDQIELTQDGRLVHQDEDDVRHFIARAEREGFVKRYVHLALAEAMMGS